MKKALFAALALLLSFSASAQTYELEGSYTAAEISTLAATFGIPPNIYQAEYGVDVYSLTYNMPYLGESIEVSGAMFLPTGFPESCDLPVHTYMHGTVFERNQAPSFMPFEAMLGYLMSSPGYIVLMPDYVGLGVSQLMHPYVQAKSEAEAGIYMMEAVESLGGELGFSFNDELFISGYSQGGHSAMAMAKEIHENYSEQYEVTACAPMAGPYNMSEVQGPLSVAEDVYPYPAFFAYNVIGWNSYYGNIYESLDEIFQEPYASMLPDLFDGETSMAVINEALPTLTSELLQPGIVDEILNDPSHPYMLAAADNDVYDWVPTCHMQMYYCDADDVVYPENTTTTFEYMVEAGAENLGTFNGGALDHSGCAGPSIFGGLIWMDQFHIDCVPESVAEFANGNSTWALAPNPAINGSTTILGAPINARWTVRDISGRIISTGTTNTVELGTTSGIYFLELEGHGVKKILN